ncbi:MAG TPA: copper resistance protein CopC [Solirubrobacterales bacterium]|nr:copper resistance protein CopC [Solirubrobacterales bacterium]
MLSSDPGAGARLGASPEAVRLTLSEQPEPALSEIHVLGADGKPEQLGHARPAGDDPLTLEVPVRRLGKGVYTVSWKVFSAIDGHATDGTYAFGVRAAPSGVVASESTTASRSSRSELLARWLFLLGVVGLIGGAVAGAARFGGDRGRDLALAAGGWALAVVGLGLLAEAQRSIAGSSFGALLDTSVGRALIWRAAALGLAALGLLAAWRRPQWRRPALAVATLAALGAVVAHVEAGHAAAGEWSATLAVAIQAAHFFAAGVWFGGLAALLLGFRGAGAAAREAAIGCFALTALASLLIVFATGVVRAFDELAAWGDLFGSGYGRAVLAKLILLLLIAAIAWRNRPRRGAGHDIQGLRRRSRVELGLAVVAIAVAALLGTLAPAGAGGPGPAGLAVAGADFGTTTRVELSTASDQPGPNLFRVRVEDYDSGEAVAADRVSLRFTPLDDPGVPTSTLVLKPGSDEDFTGSGPNLAFDGRWGVSVLVERDGDAVEIPLELDLPVPDQFVSILDIPGSPRPPQYTMQTETGYIRITPDPARPGPNRIYAHTYTGFENSVPTDQLVITITAPGEPARQLPVRRLGSARFVATGELPAGPLEIGVVARARSGERLRGVFKLNISP